MASNLFPEEYIEKCFMLWYESGCPNASVLIKQMPVAADGRLPGVSALRGWMDEYGWRSRRDKLEAQVSNKIDNALISRKVFMLEEQAASARELRKKAHEYLMENGFDSSAAAVSAFVKGAELERRTLGISKVLENLAEMETEDVMAKVRELASRSTGSVIDESELEDLDEDDA